MDSTIVVLEYDPDWVHVFHRIRDFVTPVIFDLLVTIEHVGSTSIPGLFAKPIVDVDVVVKTQADVQSAILRLATLGYVHEGDLGVAGREAFIPPNELPRHHLYVCAEDNPEYGRHILVRDYLRNHPEVATEYGELKVQLAQQYRDNRAAYTDAKTDFVMRVLRLAQLE